MKSTTKAILASLAATIGLGLSAPVLAGGTHGHRHGGHHQRHWHQHGHGPHHAYGPIVRERVVVHRPVYVAPPVYAAPVYSGYYYAPPHHSGIVVNVAIPPLVIPLR